MAISNKMSSNLLTAFNDHFADFINDIERVFPDSHDILLAKNSLFAIRKANPKLIVKIWNSFIVGKYTNEINRGDIGFFINKDYATDLVYYLVDKGIAFKNAHTIVGKLVTYSLDNNILIKEMTEPELKKFSDKFVKKEIIKLFDPLVSVRSKKSIKR